jgi:hypothetical protein
MQLPVQHSFPRYTIISEGDRYIYPSILTKSTCPRDPQVTITLEEVDTGIVMPRRDRRAVEVVLQMLVNQVGLACGCHILPIG